MMAVWIRITHLNMQVLDARIQPVVDFYRKHNEPKGIAWHGCVRDEPCK